MSAIRRGDAEAATAVSASLQQGEGKGHVPKGRADFFEAVSGALKSGGIDAARKVLEGGQTTSAVEQPVTPVVEVTLPVEQPAAVIVEITQPVESAIAPAVEFTQPVEEPAVPTIPVAPVVDEAGTSGPVDFLV